MRKVKFNLLKVELYLKIDRNCTIKLDKEAELELTIRDFYIRDYYQKL